MKSVLIVIFTLLSGGAKAFADSKVSMICEPRAGLEFPSEILSPEILFYGEGTKRYLDLEFRNSLHTVKLEALNMREFIGQLEEFTVFFELEGADFVKILLTFTNFETMESIGPLKLNCYLNTYFFE